MARQVPRPSEASRNVGHGHVHPRPDGRRARCGGPGLCRECSAEATLLAAEAWERHEAARGGLNTLNEVVSLLLLSDAPLSRRGLAAALSEARDGLTTLLEVEEPPPPPPDDNPHGLDRRVHARACGIVPHGHGSACHRDCPTCGGRSDFDHEGPQGETRRPGL